MRMFPRVVLFAFLAALAAPVVAKAGDDVPSGKLPADAIPQHYALHFTVDPRTDRFSGEARIRVTLTRPSDHVFLHAEHLDIAKATVSAANGKAMDAKPVTHADVGVLELDFGQTMPAGTIELALDYTAPFNAQLEGLYKVKVGDDAYTITQMEPISARYAFPGFDEPRFKTPFDITLTVPTDEVAVANTLQTSEKKSADGKWKTLTFATTKPLPTYLVAFAVGPWDVVDAPPIPANGVRTNPIPLRGIAPRGKGKKLAWVLGETPAVVKFYEEYTAQPYPFDKLDLLGAPDFSAGAMENAGLIVYRDALLLLDEHSPAERYRSVFNVNAHEIAHQWYGDLVTVPWWDDIWLNEAYATWAQRKATIALKPDYFGDMEALEYRLSTMKNDSLLTARKVRQPINGHGDIETAFDGITYQKGASVLAMFETWVGEDTFRKGMREYLAGHAFGSGNSDDLIASLTKASGKGDAFASSMRSFLDQPGIPLVHAQVTCKEGKASLHLSQSRYLPYGVLGEGLPHWSAPVCARFGRGTESSMQCFVLDKAEQRFDVDGGCPDWYLPNAQARGYYRFDMAPADLVKLGAAVAQLSAPEQVDLRRCTEQRLPARRNRSRRGARRDAGARRIRHAAGRDRVVAVVRMDARAARGRACARGARCVRDVDLRTASRSDRLPPQGRRHQHDDRVARAPRRVPRADRARSARARGACEAGPRRARPRRQRQGRSFARRFRSAAHRAQGRPCRKTARARSTPCRRNSPRTAIRRSAIRCSPRSVRRAIRRSARRRAISVSIRACRSASFTTSTNRK